MQFSDTTTRNGLIQDCEFWTAIGDAAISGTTATLQHFTRLINARYHQVVTMILRAQDEWDFDDAVKTDYPIYTTSLVADQADYTFPTSLKILKIKRVEVTYDGGTNWYKAEPLDINEYTKNTTAATISQNFVKTSPFYDIQYNSLFLYPVPTAASTNGLKIWISREITEFATSATTAEPGFDEPFHRMLSIGASLDYAVAKGLSNKNDLAALWADYEARLNEYYGSKQKDREYILKPGYQDYR